MGRSRNQRKKETRKRVKPKEIMFFFSLSFLLLVMFATIYLHRVWRMEEEEEEERREEEGGKKSGRKEEGMGEEGKRR